MQSQFIVRKKFSQSGLYSTQILLNDKIGQGGGILVAPWRIGHFLL